MSGGDRGRPRPNRAPGSKGASSRVTLARAARTGLIALTAVALSGCLQTHTGRPEERGPRANDTAVARERVAPASWRQVLFGSPPRPVLTGYVKTLVEPDPLAGTRFVYDAVFTPMGRISPGGQTFRLLHGGREIDEGTYVLQHALLLLFGEDRRSEVSLAPMPPPRG